MVPKANAKARRIEDDLCIVKNREDVVEEKVGAADAAVGWEQVWMCELRRAINADAAWGIW